MYRYEMFKALCDSNHLRPSDVSRGTGISTATLSSWKNGKYQPKSDKIKIIADYFEVPMSYFETGVIPEDFRYSSPAQERMLIQGYLETIGYGIDINYPDDGENFSYTIICKDGSFNVDSETLDDFVKEIHDYCSSFIKTSLANRKGTLPPQSISDIKPNEIELLYSYRNANEAIIGAVDKLLDIQKESGSESRTG